MICPLEGDWCPVHNRKHLGRERTLSQMDNIIGEAYRKSWSGETVTEEEWSACLKLASEQKPRKISKFSAAVAKREEVQRRFQGKPIYEWPFFARVIARIRTQDDKGIGDTIARNLNRFGAKAIKRLYNRLVGSDCGCSDRQKKLNQIFPYRDT